jgi:hypothetical protein
MSSRSVPQAGQATTLSPEQERKVKEIKLALGAAAPGTSLANAPKVNRAIYDHIVSIETFERSALKSNTGRISPEWLKRIAGLQTEMLGARAKLDQLNTGLRAQRRLHDALTEMAAAFGAWHRGLGSSDLNVIDEALASMQRHFANADRLGAAGLEDLRQGR